MTRNQNLRVLIDEIGLSGGLPATLLYDVAEILEERYQKRFKYKREITPRQLGAILREYPNVEKIYLSDRGRHIIKVRIHPLISNGDNEKMVHKCEWKKYLIIPDGRFKMCKICGLILREEDADLLDNYVSKNQNT
jgi:hypothetical protein